MRKVRCFHTMRVSNIQMGFLEGKLKLISFARDKYCTSLEDPASMAEWSNALPLTARCLSPLKGPYEAEVNFPSSYWFQYK